MITRREFGRRVGIVSGTVAVVLVAFSAWAVGTRAGTTWSVERLGAIVPGKLKIADVRGPLRGPLTLYGLSYASDQVEVTADRVALDWRIGELMYGKRLDIKSLAAHNVKITFHFRDVMPDTTILPDVDLPVTILVRKAAIDTLTLYGISLPPDTSLAIDHVSLASTEFRDTLGIQELSLTSPKLDATFVGSLLPRGDYPIDARVKWRWRSPSGIDVKGGGTLRGTLATLEVDQAVDSPFTAHLVGRQYHATSRGRFVGQASARDVRATDFVATAPQGLWSGTVRFDGVPLAFAAEGSIEGAGTLIGPVTGQGRVRRDSTRWAFDDVLVRRPGTAMRIAARGVVTAPANETPLVDAQADWRDFAWPIGGRPVVLSREGRAAVRGSLGGYDVHAEGLLADARTNETRFTLAGRGDSTHVALSDVRATALHGNVRGRGNVSWRPAVRWDMVAEGDSLDPGVRWPGWNGALHFALATTGTYDRVPRGRVDVRELSGTMRGRPVSGHAAFAFSDWTRGTLDTLALASEDATIGARGAYGGPWDLAWALNAPRLGVLAPGGAGVLKADGTITGASEPRFVAHMLADTVALRDVRVTHLEGAFDVGTSRTAAVTADIHGNGLAWRNRHADSLAFVARGTGGSHTAEFRLDSATEQWKAGLAGGFAQRSWSGTVNALDLVSQRVGTWGLASPAPLSVDADQARLENLCWRSGGSSLCVDGSIARGEGWQASAKLDSLRLALLAPLLDRDYQVEGRMDGTAQFSADASGALSGEAHLLPGPGQLTFANGAAPDSVTFERGTFDATVGPAGWDSKFALKFAGTDALEGSLALPGYRQPGTPPPSQAVRGTFTAHARDLRFAQAFFSHIAETRGALDADLAIEGTLARPSLSGTVAVDSASATLPELGTRLHNVDLRLTGEGGRHLALKGGMTSGDGRVTIDGSATITDDGTPTATLALKGDRFLAANRQDLRLVTSPDLTAKLEGGHASLNGTLTVPEGDITLENMKPVVRPSLDVRLVSANLDTLPVRPGLLVDGTVRVVLGDKVTIKGQGLTGRTTGQVLVTQVAGGVTRASGEVAIEDGTYEAYGQSFTIERGRLLYAGGPVENPGLDLRASRVAGAVTAGFEVRGTLENPRLTVFSDPAMGDNEALAYAITGRPLENMSVGQSAQVADAASTFAVQQGNPLASNVAKSLGLKEARIQSGGTFQQTELFLGTQLTPKLYLGYGVGLFENLNVFRMRYLLNSNFTLEAETAKEARANILFTREH